MRYLACIILGLSLLTPLGAGAKEPLLIPGKKTLYQRVVVHPGAALYEGCHKEAAVRLKQVTPFTVFYVYQRTSSGGQDWVQVGPSGDGRVLGCLQAAKTSDWQYALTPKFTERAGREPVLFFRTQKDLEGAALAGDVVRHQKELAKRFAEIRESKADPPPDFPVVAMEPMDQSIPRDRFYLLPIFQWTEPADEIRFLEVASIDPGWPGVPEIDKIGVDRPAGAAAPAAPGPGEQRVGIAFVMDTTISMGPYIERARQAVRGICDSACEADMGDRLAFALVAYRSSTRKTPGLEYTTRVVSDFVPATQRQRFDRAVASVQEAKVSSHAFNEDAYAGLITALNELNWEPYHGRLIFLVTDAGALRTGDPYASTDVNGPELANLAQAKHVKIMALHMKTPAGKRSGFDNHASAAMQYQALTRQQDAELKDLYFPLDAPSAAKGQEQMDRVVKDVSRQMVKMIRHTAHGKKLPKPQDKPSQQPDDAARKAEVLGYALQLDFLGKRQGVRAPRVRRAWVADKDLTNLANPAFQVCVLLSKTQLSDLQKRLKVLVEETQRTKRTGAKDLFESILSATASFSRDPKSFTRNPEADLQELGVLGEYLEDLPYKSRVMTMTQDDWYRMSVGEQQAFVENLKSKIAAYRRYHDDTDNWESFGSQRPGDALYRVPLSMLP